MENISQANRNLEIEALEHNKKICANNDGLSGTAATEWAVRIADETLDANDEFVFVQRGTNDRGLTPTSVAGISANSGLRQFKDAMEIIIGKVQTIYRKQTCAAMRQRSNGFRSYQRVLYG